MSNAESNHRDGSQKPSTTTDSNSRFSVKALRQKCECEKCLSGEATSHNDEVRNSNEMCQQCHISLYVTIAKAD